MDTVFHPYKDHEAANCVYSLSSGYIPLKLLYGALCSKMPGKDDLILAWTVVRAAAMQNTMLSTTTRSLCFRGYFTDLIATVSQLQNAKCCSDNSMAQASSVRNMTKSIKSYLPCKRYTTLYILWHVAV